MNAAAGPPAKTTYATAGVAGGINERRSGAAGKDDRHCGEDVSGSNTVAMTPAAATCTVEDASGSNMHRGEDASGEDASGEDTSGKVDHSASGDGRRGDQGGPVSGSKIIRVAEEMGTQDANATDVVGGTPPATETSEDPSAGQSMPTRPSPNEEASHGRSAPMWPSPRISRTSVPLP